MRNLLDQPPPREFHGGLAHATGLVELADIEGRDLLDVGCGFGWFELFALERDAASATGVEISDEDLRTARRHIEDERASFVVGSAIELPFPDQSFDTVVCWEVLEHIPPNGEGTAFREIHRVLRPGGVLYLSTPYASGIARLLDPAWWLIGHRHYRKRALADFASAAGLEVELLEVRGGIWQLVGILNLYVAKWVFRREPFLEDAINRRMDREFSRPSGYANAFLKCRRVRQPR